jgi:hypothetical protein
MNEVILKLMVNVHSLQNLPLSSFITEWHRNYFQSNAYPLHYILSSFYCLFCSLQQVVGVGREGGLNSSFPIWENQAAPLNYKTLKIIYCVLVFNAIWM